MSGSWDDLRFFLALGREQTLGRAAKALGVDASTVFRRLGVLEERLGARLVERRGRGYVLTAAGEALLAHAARMDEEALAAERAIIGHDAGLEGSIVLTTTDTLAHRFLGPHLDAFRETYPRITLEIAVDNRVLSLVRREADVAIRPGGRPTEKGVVGRRVGAVAGALYASTRYLARHGTPDTLDALAGHHFVGGDASLRHVGFIQWPEVRWGDRIVVRTGSVLAMASLIEAGLGVGAVPCYLLDERPDVVRLFPPEQALTSELWLLLHADLRQTARVRAFVDFLWSAIRAERPRLEARADAG